MDVDFGGNANIDIVDVGLLFGIYFNDYRFVSKPGFVPVG